jgi:lactate permease
LGTAGNQGAQAATREASVYAIGAAAVGMAGQEGDLFRTVLKWSLILILVMCVLVYLQSTAVADWMVVQ